MDLTTNVFSNKSIVHMYSRVNPNDSNILALYFFVKVEETFNSIGYFTIKNFFISLNDHTRPRSTVLKLKGDVLVGNTVSFSYIDTMHDGDFVVFFDIVVSEKTETFLREWKKQGAYITPIRENNHSLKIQLN